MDQRLFAPPHDFSQLITSFIACKSLGIHRTPFLTCLHAPHLCGRCLLKVVRFSKFNEFMSLKSLISFSLMLFVLLNFLEDYLYCLKFARFFVTLFNCLIEIRKNLVLSNMSKIVCNVFYIVLQLSSGE